MNQVIAISWLNKILLLSSIGCATLCLIIEKSIGLLTISLIWSMIVISGSTWLCCFLLKSTSNDYFKPFMNLIIAQLSTESTNLTSNRSTTNSFSNLQNKSIKFDDKNDPEKSPQINNSIKIKKSVQIEKFTAYFEEEFIKTWYNTLTSDQTFLEESKKILKELIEKLWERLSGVNKTYLIRKISDIILLHLKEYRRALRRVQKEPLKSLSDVYKYSHPGSKNQATLNYSLHRLVTLTAREFLQKDLITSLPGQFMLSILSKQLLGLMLKASKPQWFLEQVSGYLQPKEPLKSSEDPVSGDQTLKTIPLNTNLSTTPSTNSPPIVEIIEIDSPKIPERPSNFSSDLSSVKTEPRVGLWAESNQGDEQASPVYEEPTDFATTIARLRNLLQEKSTATSPDESSYEICDNKSSQLFINLSIPRTEFHTAHDGSQQLLYCIQFDDVEQHGEYSFEKTSAIVRRKYSDFLQLHASLDETCDVKLPDGGRVEMEGYLRGLCQRLGDSSPQLRHFLKPSSLAEKKADTVAPRFDGILAKTVTGVFNTLKTVVPVFEAEESDVVLPTLMSLADVPWRFVEDVKGKNLADELEQLMAERNDYCSVDAAYEAVENVDDETGVSELMVQWWESKNEHPWDEELDEIDGNLRMTCIFVDILCEILAGSGSINAFRQEAVVRWFKIFFGHFCELCINKRIQELFINVQNSFAEFFSNEGDCCEDKKVLQLGNKFIDDLAIIFGKNDVQQMIGFLRDSVETEKINLDLILRILDAGVSELLAACKTN